MYDTVTYTVKVDAMVASRFDTMLEQQYNAGAVTGFTDDREPPLNHDGTIEAAVIALIKDGRVIIAVKLVREHTEYRSLAEAKEVVFYYRRRVQVA